LNNPIIKAVHRRQCNVILLTGSSWLVIQQIHDIHLLQPLYSCFALLLKRERNTNGAILLLKYTCITYIDGWACATFQIKCGGYGTGLVYPIYAGIRHTSSDRLLWSALLWIMSTSLALDLQIPFVSFLQKRAIQPHP
jgi:hypothetical protein